MNDIVESFENYLDRLPKGSLWISEQLRKDNLHEAFKAIEDFSEGMLWMQEANIFLKQHEIKTNLDFMKITEFLLEINEGMILKDYILIADIFEYEIPSFFESVKIEKGHKNELGSL